jgi:hypothetical protein
MANPLFQNDKIHNRNLEIGMRMMKSVTAAFQQMIAKGTARTGSPEAYDRWAQREQARVLIEYAQRQVLAGMSEPGQSARSI